jgi:hypothetical protein
MTQHGWLKMMTALFENLCYSKSSRDVFLLLLEFFELCNDNERGNHLTSVI